MEQKVKFIIIGLAGLLLVTLFFALQATTVKGKLEVRVKQLGEENASLMNKVNAISQEAERFRSKANSLNKEIERISLQKDDLQKRVDLVSKEKEELIDKLKEIKDSAKTQGEQKPAAAGANDAYWANILKTNADLELKVSTVRSELRDMQIKNEELDRAKKSLELDINNLERDKKDLQRQLDYNQKLSENLTNELVSERNDKFKLQETFKSVQSENTALRRQLTRLNGRKIALERDIQKLTEDKDNLERTFANMEKVLKGNVSEICQLKDQLSQIRSGNVVLPPQEQDSIDLPPIVVRPQADASIEPADTNTPPPPVSPAGPIVGKVLSIDRGGNFVIVDLGEEAGIKAGDLLQVTRDDKDVGLVSVVQTRKDISACDIKRESLPIKIGDIASK